MSKPFPDDWLTRLFQARDVWGWYECLICGAAVFEENTEVHARWHWDNPATRSGWQ